MKISEGKSGGFFWGLTGYTTSGKISSQLLALIDEATYDHTDFKRTPYAVTDNWSSIQIHAQQNGKISCAIESELYNDDDLNGTVPSSPLKKWTYIELYYNSTSKEWQGQKLISKEYTPKHIVYQDGVGYVETQEQSPYSWWDTSSPDFFISTEAINRIYYKYGKGDGYDWGFNISYLDLDIGTGVNVSYNISDQIYNANVVQQGAWAFIDDVIPTERELLVLVKEDIYGTVDDPYTLISQNYDSPDIITVLGEINLDTFKDKDYFNDLDWFSLWRSNPNRTGYAVSELDGGSTVALFDIDTRPSSDEDWNRRYAVDNLLLVRQADGYNGDKVIALDLPEAAGLEAGTWQVNGSEPFSTKNQSYNVFNVNGSLYVISQIEDKLVNSKSGIQLKLYQVVFGDSTPELAELKTKSITYESLGITSNMLKSIDKYARSGKITLGTPVSQNIYMSYLIQDQSIPADLQKKLSNAFAAYSKFQTSAGTEFLAGIGDDTYNFSRTGINIDETFGSGTDLVISSVETCELQNGIENLRLKDQSDAITGYGNASNNKITGNANANIFNGEAGSDTLTGGAGADGFMYESLENSLLANFDRITDFKIGEDLLYGPVAVASSSVAKLGKVANLSNSKISALLNNTAFHGNGAATFTTGSGSKLRTFVAINDSIDGFNQYTDGIVEITGYKGSLSGLAISQQVW